MRFSISHLLFTATIIALSVAWFCDHRRLVRELFAAKTAAQEMRRFMEREALMREDIASFDLSAVEMSSVDEDTTVTRVASIIDTLHADTPESEALAAHRLLLVLGKDAFPDLIGALGDQRQTHLAFLGDVSEGEPPTIGAVCFEILQQQIEGLWPKAFRDYRILNRSNVETWIADRASMPLAEMRLEARRQAIARCEEHVTQDVSQSATAALEWLKEPNSAHYFQDAIQRQPFE